MVEQIMESLAYIVGIEASRDGDGLASLLSILGPAHTSPDLVLGPSSPRMISPVLLYDL